MIQNKLLAFLMLCSSYVAFGQDAQFDSWMYNTDGHQAYYEKNSTPGPGTEIVYMTDSSDIKNLYYTTSDIYVSCDGLGSYQMGEWSIPNEPSALGYVFSLPRTPQEETGTKTAVPEGGPIGVAINGIPFYGYESAESWDGGGMSFTGDGIWNADAWLNEGTTMDDMGGGHPTDMGAYHYHATPFALYSTTNTGHSPIIGWAPDGYPIYGPFGYSDAMNSSSSVVRMETSYQKRSITQRNQLPDGTMLPPPDWGPDVDATYVVGYFVEDYEYSDGLGHLDEYNGRTCVTPEYPSGTYAYFITVDGTGEPEFPYLLASEYYGVATTAGIGNATIPGGATKYTATTVAGDEIINVSPSSSTAVSGVTITFDIDTSATSSNDPPYSVAPDDVTLGGISGTTISRDGTSGTITATFDLSTLSTGTYEIAVTFNPPMGAAIVNSTADVFTITSGSTGSTGEANLTEWWYNKYGSTITIPSTSETIITDVEHVHYDDDNIYISSSGVPNYYSDETFFTASDQDWTYFIPKDPVEETGSKTSVSVYIGLFVDGTAALSPGDGQSYNNDDIWNQLAYEFEGNDFDGTNGHSTAANIYHHHVANKALYDFDGSAHSPIIGFAFDGYPIYGPYGYSDSLDNASGISRMTPSYQKRNITDRTTLPDGTVLSPSQYGPDLTTEELGKYEEDYEFVSGSGTLDYYNGRYCVTPEYPSGTYAYFISVDAANDPIYPYIAGLEFYGDVATQNFGPSGGATTIPGTAVEYIEIIQDPSDYAGTVGNTAYFKSDCNGTPSTVVWQESIDNGTTWNNLNDDGTYSGTTTDSLGISNVTSGMFSYLYRLYITGDNSIDSSASAELTGGSSITVTASASPSATICIGESVTLSATGATNYFWNESLGAGASHVVSPTTTTTYTVSGDDGAGNVDTDQITITVNALPTVSAGSDQTVCSGSSVTLSGSGAASYSWDNSVTDGVAFAATSTTTYTVTGTDANGCVNTDDVTVTVNDLPTVSAGSDQTVCSGSSVTLSGSGAASYSWDNSVTDGVAFTAASTTTYTVTGTDANGCVNTDDVTVTVNDLPTVSAGSDQTVCSGTSVTLSGSGANTYSWDNSVTDGVSFSPSSTATYTVTGTDANGCVNTDDVTITVNALPTVSAGSDQTVCSGSSVTLNGSGAASYSWDNSVTDGVAFTVASTTTYTVSGTDANGCVNTDDVTVTVNDLPTVSAGSDQTVCSGSSVTLSGSGAASYSWDNSVTDGVSFSPAATATYTVTGTDANGCVNTDDVTVTVNDLPTVSAGSDQTICTGSSVTLSGSGANAYSWDNSVTDGVSFSPAATVTYTVTGTDANGCVNTDDVTVTVNALPTVSAGADQTICEGTSVTLSGSGANTYSWDNSVTDGVSFAPTATITYTVTGTDANGCINTDDVTITIDAMPTADAGVDQSVCADNTVLGATNPTIGSGSWSVVTGSGTVTTPSSATSTVTGLVDGTTLDLLWTVSNGVCPDATDDVSISRTSSAPVSVTITPNDPSLCLGDGQTFTANPVNGGTNPQYEWFLNSNSQGVGTSSTFSIVTATDGDEVEVILTSDLGCATGNPATSATSTVTVNPLPTVSAGSDQIVCSGSSVTLNGAGATSYSWDNSITDGVAFTANSTTTYTVTGTDANGCVNTDDVTITVNDLPTVSAGSDQTVCVGSSVTLNGLGAVSYNWDNSVTDGVSFSPSSTTTYTVTGTDANGCVNTDDITVTVNDLPTVSAGADQTVCTNDMVTLSGSGANTYSWDNSVNDGVAFSATATTTYTVSGTDANGCINTDDVTITVQSTVTPSVSIGGSDVCAGDNMIITVSDSLGGGNNPTFAWTIDGNPVGSDQNNIMVTSTNGGEVVMVTMTSNLSCVTSSTATDQLTTTVNALPIVDAGTDQTVCNGTDVTLSGSGASSYTWDNGISDGVTFTVTSTTTYTVVGTDVNGCSSSDDVIITVDPCTAIADANEVKIGLYPNPTSGLITITGINGEYELVLVNELGNTINSWNGVSANETQLNLSDYSSGVYFIKVISNGELNILRVILE